MRNLRHLHHPHIPLPHFAICRSCHHLGVLAVMRPLTVVVADVDVGAGAGPDADADPGAHAGVGAVGAVGAVLQLQRQQLVTL